MHESEPADVEQDQVMTYAERFAQMQNAEAEMQIADRPAFLM